METITRTGEIFQTSTKTMTIDTRAMVTDTRIMEIAIKMVETITKTMAIGTRTMETGTTIMAIATRIMVITSRTMVDRIQEGIILTGTTMSEGNPEEKARYDFLTDMAGPQSKFTDAHPPNR